MKNIPEDLSNKIKNPLQTPANNADPKMDLTVVRAKDTVMDNTYWTTEVIRTKEGLGDLSVAARRLKPYGGPDSLYNIYVDNGVVKTAIRAYPDYQKDGWEDQFELGAGTACAICFDGYWELYKKKWQMVTSEKPWIFWVTGGVLYTQYWDDISTRLELSTNVTKVKSIRAWKNQEDPTLDQGVVVGYIKTDGSVYYRNYSYQVIGEFGWEYEKKIDEIDGVNVNLNLFITNDYRIGFIVENSTGQITFIITSRMWAGMAIPPEYLGMSITNLNFDVTSIKTYMFGLGDEKLSDENMFGAAIKRGRVDGENLETAITSARFYVCPISISPEPDIINVDRLSFTDNKTIQLTFNYNLECDLVRLKLGLSLQTTSGVVLEIDTVVENENILTITTVDEMRLMDNVVLTFTNIGGYVLAVRINETCVLDYGKSINLSILGAPPEVQENLPVFIDAKFTVIDIIKTETFETENLVAGIDTLVFTVTEVNTHYRMTDEYIVSGVSNINFVVTQTGTSPV